MWTHLQAPRGGFYHYQKTGFSCKESVERVSCPIFQYRIFGSSNRSCRKCQFPIQNNKYGLLKDWNENQLLVGFCAWFPRIQSISYKRESVRKIKTLYFTQNYTQFLLKCKNCLQKSHAGRAWVYLTECTKKRIYSVLNSLPLWDFQGKDTFCLKFPWVTMGWGWQKLFVSLRCSIQSP